MRNTYSKILVRTTSPDRTDSESLAKAVLNYYSDSQNEVDIIEGEDYCTLIMILVVKEDELCDSLQGLDTIRSGYFEGSSDITEGVYTGLKYEIIHSQDTFLVDLVQSNRYLLNKVQEQTVALESVEYQVSELNEQFCKIANILQGHQERYESFNSYIHSYVDIESLVGLVLGIADEVEVDVDQYYNRPTIQ